MLNHLLNTLAYNPPGKEEGYLFWAAWANHIGAPVFSTQDAHGPIRRGLVLGLVRRCRCSRQLSGPTPQLGTLVDAAQPARPERRVPDDRQAGSTPAQPGPTTPTVPTLPVRGQGRTS